MLEGIGSAQKSAMSEAPHRRVCERERSRRIRLRRRIMWSENRGGRRTHTGSDSHCPLRHRQRRQPSDVIRAPQLRQYGPSARCEPLLHRIRKTVTTVGGLGEITGEDRPVTAHRARDIERRRRGFAVVAMRSGNRRTRIAGIRVQPDDSQVRALVGGFRSRTRLVAAARADPRRPHRRNRICGCHDLGSRRR